MQILLASVVTILTAAAPVQSQPSGLAATPLTITFANTVTLEQALSTLSRVSGVVMEINRDVPEEALKQPVSPASTVSMRNVTLEQAVSTLTHLKGLSFVVVNPKMVLVFKKV